MLLVNCTILASNDGIWQHLPPSRRALATECNAPIGADEDVKVREDQQLKRVRSAARALLRDREAADGNPSKKVPPARAAELRQVLGDFYELEPGQEEIAIDVLERAASLDPV